jgi:pimeloyl-ACP methyl ester carboxylesterase
MNERICSFGQTRRLVGVLNLPERTGRRATALIFLNAGLIHRVGPYRMHVDLARRLALLGYPSFRLDQSGLGDSEPRCDDLSLDQGCVEDIRETMDLITKRSGVQHFVALGLCSGAVAAHRALVADERLKGAVFLDGYVYPTTKTRVRYYAMRLLSPPHVARTLRRQIERISLKFASAAQQEAALQRASQAEVLFEREDPPRAVAAEELECVARRGARFLFVYTGENPDEFNYAQQLFDMFPGPELRKQAEVAYFPRADHTFTLLEGRANLFQRVLDWMTQYHP